MEAEYNDRFCSIIKVLPDEVIEEYKAYPNYSEDKIDFVYPDLTPPVFIAQYDEKRTVIALQLYKAGRKYILPEQIGVNVRWGKPDQTYVYKSVEGCNSARDTVYILVDYQMSVVYGTIKPTIEVVTPDKFAVAAESHFKVVIVQDPIQEGMVESAAVHFGIATIDDNHVTNHTVYSSEFVEYRISQVFGKVIEYHTTEYYNTHPSLIYPEGTVIVYSDYYKDKDGNDVPGVKISTGVNYAIDLPFITKCVEQSIEFLMGKTSFWDNKLNCEDEVIGERLVLNRN